MNEADRTGVNIRSAFLASGHRISPASASALNQEASAFTPEIQTEIATAPAPAVARGACVKRAIKQFLRPMIGAIYRAAKPVLRPVAFRLRAYLLTPLQLEAQRTVQLTQSIQATQQRYEHALTAEMRALHATLAQNIQLQRDELASTGLQLLQELQSARDSIARSISAARLEPERFGILEDRLERIEEYAFASARRMAVAGSPGEVLVRTSVGYVLCPASDYPLLATLVDVGELELGTRKLIQKLLRPGDTFVDVGANVGMHTLAAAIAMQAQGRIVAFEPHPTTHDLLRKSLLLNGFAGIAETHQAAVSNQVGQLPLFLGPTSGHHSLYSPEGSTGAMASTIDVPLVRLDDVLNANAPVDLIKIDVEGAELEVIEGAAATIRRNVEAALIVEFGSSHLRRTGRTTGDWLSAFEKFGLQFRAIEPATGALLDWTSAELEAVESVNLLFARPTSKAWVRAGVDA